MILMKHCMLVLSHAELIMAIQIPPISHVSRMTSRLREYIKLIGYYVTLDIFFKVCV